MLGLRRKTSAGSRARAALIAGATVAAIGLGGLNAGSAAASPKCTGSAIEGVGSSLQNVAQKEVFIPGFKGICASPAITYAGGGSGKGLKEWRLTGEEPAINTAFGFVGTDDAPTKAQMEHGEAVAGGAKVAVIPVAQTAISIVAHPPAGCTVEAITNENLAGVFEGRINEWSKLEFKEGGEACKKPITRIVREDGSGTTFQTKNYLFQLVKGGLSCTEGLFEPGKKATWQQLEPQTTPNLTWPETCTEKTLSAVKRANGGGALVNKVIAEEGTIGYAALPDAKTNIAKAGGEEATHTSVLALQDNSQKKGGEALFAFPEEGETANCSSMTYQVPKLNGPFTDIDWSAVFGAKPYIGNEAYPLCTLTYDLAWHGYGKAGFTEGQEITARDYLTEYITQPAGQAAIASHYYSPLPTSGQELLDVLGAAKKAAKEVSF